VNPVNGIDFLENLSSRGFSHVVINPPLSGRKAFAATPIKAVMAHLKVKGNIKDFAV
jgi:hypothetical protein